MSRGTGKYTKWKQTLASGNDEIVLFEDEEIYVDDAISRIKKRVMKGRRIAINFISEYEMNKEYHVKIINFEYRSPLKQ